VIPGFAPNGALQSAHVLGWIDNTHLLLMIDLSTGFAFPPLESASVAPSTAAGAPAIPPLAAAAPRGASTDRHALTAPFTPPHSSNQPETIATVDITTGGGYTIATLPAGSLAALSPDGTQVIVQNSCVSACIAAALTTEIIDTRTGAVHSLPQIDKVIAPSVAFVWDPLGDYVAATTGGAPSDHPTVYVADIQHDSAGPSTPGFVIGWSPDGRSLLVGDAAAIGGTATKARFTMPGTNGNPVALPQAMVAFIGWVRTA
jgi:hypothetical protein